MIRRSRSCLTIPTSSYFGGVGPYTSTNREELEDSSDGSSWRHHAITHTDQHAVAVDPFNSNFLYIGNDGGFYSYDLEQGRVDRT